MSVLIHLIAFAGAVILTMLTMAPIFHFYVRGWKIKQNDIMSSFNGRARELYFKFFHDTQPADPTVAFEQLYEIRYGPNNLRIPIGLLTVVLVPLLFLVMETALARIVVYDAGHRSILGQQVLGPLVTLPSVAVAGIVGGFLWITADLLQRCRTNDLAPGDLQNSALRVSMAAPMGYALGAVINPALGAFVAFAFGAFPLAQVSVIFRRLANRQLNLEIGSDSSDGQLRKLEGIDAPTSDKLLDAGITTVAQLAYCDPVQLCMRTGLGFAYIMDITGQALSWVYLEEQLNKIRCLGLRGAIELRHFYDDLSSNDATRRDAAEALLAVVAVTAGTSQQGMRNVVMQVALDPYTEFLDAVWD